MSGDLYTTPYRETQHTAFFNSSGSKLRNINKFIQIHYKHNLNTKDRTNRIVYILSISSFAILIN